jgi:hypothetical protein
MTPGRNKLWFLLSTFLLYPSVGFSQDSTLVSFKIKDQFNREYTEESWGDSIIVLFGSDKDGIEYNKIWGKAVHDSLKATNGFEKIKFVGLSDLRIVPFFLKELVKTKLPKDKRKRVLLDWQGVFPKTYQFESGACNILIFNSVQKLIHKTAVHQLSQEELKLIVEKIKALLLLH